MPWRSPSKLTFDANRAEQAHSARHVLAGEISARYGPQRVRSWRSFCRTSYCPSRQKLTQSVISQLVITALRKVCSITPSASACGLSGQKLRFQGVCRASAESLPCRLPRYGERLPNCRPADLTLTEDVDDILHGSAD